MAIGCVKYAGIIKTIIDHCVMPALMLAHWMNIQSVEITSLNLDTYSLIEQSMVYVTAIKHSNAFGTL